MHRFEDRVASTSDLKVLFSYDIFLAQAHGGASRLFAGLHRALVARGVRSRICGGLYVNEYLSGQDRVTGWRVAGTPSPAARRLYSMCNTTLDRAMVGTWRPSLYRLTYFPRRTGPVPVPVVVTVLDMIHELYREQFSVDDHTSARKRHWSNAADLIFAISQQTKQDLVTVFSIAEEKVAVVYPGVSKLHPDPDLDLRPFGDYLLYVGDRQAPYKNFGSFVAALARSEIARNLQFVCFGASAMTTTEELLLRNFDLLRQAHFVQGTDAELAALYSGARALVYPSNYEGFGFPPLEAMSHGCAVACSFAGSISEVVGDAALLFDPTDLDDMAAALDTIVADETLRTRVIAAGALRAQLFTWDRAASATLKEYARLTGGRL